MHNTCQNSCKKNSEIPFKCRMICVSLIGGSLILTFVFFIYYLEYISIETAIWVSAGVFIILAIYESILFSLLTRHMINMVNKDIAKPDHLGEGDIL